MMWRFIVAFLLVSTPCITGVGQTLETGIDSLTVSRAIDIALRNHPSLLGADAEVRSAEAVLQQARSIYFPLISGNATATHTDGAFVFNPDFPPRNQTYNNYTAGLQAQQTIIDFGRQVHRVMAGSSFVDAAEADRSGTRASVRLNVELAYYGFVEAKQIVGVNQEAVTSSEAHLNQAKAFYAVGRRAKFDVTKAEVDLANANVNAITARNQLRVSKLALDNAMGIRTKALYVVDDSLVTTPFGLSLDSVRSIAVIMRPELIAARARLEGNRATAGAIWDQHLPTLSATGNWNWSNFDFPLFSRWSAGVTLSIPIFQGFAIKGQADAADAAADAAESSLHVLEQAVLLEVEQTYLSLREAEERNAATEKLVEQATENLSLAERQYASGIGSAIEVADAQLSLSNARLTRIQARFDYNSSLARLNRAMGITEK